MHPVLLVGSHFYSGLIILNPRCSFDCVLLRTIDIWGDFEVCTADFILLVILPVHVYSSNTDFVILNSFYFY